MRVQLEEGQIVAIPRDAIDPAAAYIKLMYIPEPERVYGYFHLPILYGDQLVARIEPKMDRRENKFLIRGYWTEPDFEESEDYKDKLIKNLEALATFHGTKNIEWLS